MNERKTIAVVGAGITGLTTAYYLLKEIEERQLDYDVKLIEASERLGGKIWTEKRDDYIIERGPDSFLARKEPAVRLAKQLGLENELVRNETGQSFILIDKTLHEIPKGFFMGVPTSVEALQHTTLLSEEGKRRAEQEETISPSESIADQSLGSFLRRRFGDEVVENSVEPLLSGIYSGDLDGMGLKATFPQFLALEQEHGSLMKGLAGVGEKPKKQAGKTPGQFFAFKNGLETIVAQLEREIGADVISLNNKVKTITFENGKYTIEANETIEADAVVMTTPHSVLPQVFAEYDLFDPFKTVPMNSVANVALAFDASMIKQEQEGTGFVVSRNSDLRITACTWTHRKWNHTTPEGKALLRAYVGKPSDQEVVSLPDEEIIDIVLQDMKKTMPISGEPEFAVVSRWENAMPQYTVGHKERIAKVREQMNASLPGAFIVGSSYEGVGIPDCIGQAEQVTVQVLQHLQEE